MANSLVKFAITTKTVFSNISVPDVNTLYFLSDTKDIYKGSTRYTGAIELYTTTRPATGVEGRLYVDTTGVTPASVYTGGAWVAITSPLSQVVIDGGSATSKAVSGVAVEAYINNLALAKASDVVTDVKYDEATTSLKYTKNGIESALSLTKLGTILTYDGATGVIAMKDSAGTVLSQTTIPIDNFVKSGTYNTTDSAIELTMQNGTIVKIPAADLVRMYDAQDSSTIDITIHSVAGGSNIITAEVKISATAGNALTAQADGLYVDKAAIQTIGVAADAGKVSVIDATGKIAVGNVNINDIASKTYVDSAMAWQTIS